MKNKLQRVFMIVMALNVLVSTHGFAFYEHLCKFTFQKSFSLSPDACEVETPPPPPAKHGDGPCFDKDSCCEVSVSFHKIDHATDHFYKLKTFATDLLAYVPRFEFVSALSFINERFVLNYANSSPPFQARSLYILFDVFRI